MAGKKELAGGENKLAATLVGLLVVRCPGSPDLPVVEGVADCAKKII